ncbi:hypothetical protein HN011_000446 [Eciton burchellii]|nr:hypothetical protein HN011_000446 [Eciton burchellii]
MTRSGNVDIRSVFEEYLQKEQEFGQEIEECNRLRREIRDKNISRVSARPATNLPLSLEKSRIRNQILFKDLEMCRARLRTYASYTPTDEELQQISSAYRSYSYKKLQSTIQGS